MLSKEKMIEIENLYFKYSKDKEDTLKGINLSVDEAEMVLIAGKTGCGKSTLLKVINGVLVGNKSLIKGVIKLNGLNANIMSAEDIGLLIGTVYQTPADQLFAMTVEDEVGFVLEAHGVEPEIIKNAVSTTLKKVGLDGLEKAGIHTLSGGQVQRLALASVIVNKPKVLILDEPVSQLNPKGVKQFIKLLKKLNLEEKMTIIVIEHRVNELAEYFKRLVFMKKGRIVFDGNINEAWSVVGNQLESGLREPQNVKLCRFLKLSKLSMNLNETTDLISKECTLKKENRNSNESFQIENVGANTVLKVENLSFTYPGKKTKTLKNINFNLFEGEIVAVMGFNGAGKSTLFNLIAGLNSSTGGKLTFLGNELSKNVHKIGFLRQEADLMLLADTVFEEIKWNNKIENRKVKEILEKFNLLEKAQEFPLTLSKGERLRTAFAAVLARNPKLLLLDEPTTGQDQESLVEIKKTILVYRKNGGSVLLCTHDVELASEIASKVILMKEGEIFAIGSPLEILSDEEKICECGLENPPMVSVSKNLKINKCITIKGVLNYVNEATVGRV